MEVELLRTLRAVAASYTSLPEALEDENFG